MADNISQQAIRYYELVRQGVSPQEAFRQAFPNGIPTAQDRAKEQAKAGQKQAIGSVGGVLAGALGTRAVFDAVTGKPILGFGSEAAKTALAAPELISATPAAEAGATALAGGGGVGGGGAGALGGTEAVGGFGSYAMPALGALLAAEVGTQGWEGVNKIRKGKDLSFREQVALALPTFGTSFLYNPVKGYFDKDMWKTEGNRLRDVGAPQALIDQMPTRGRSKEELIEIERQNNGNVAFAESRNEADLRPVDIVNYAAFAENDPTWFKRSMDDRLKYADQALKAGAVREHHGTIDVDFSKLGSNLTQALTPNMPIRNLPAPIAPKRQMTPEELRAHGQFGSRLVGALNDMQMRR